MCAINPTHKKRLILDVYTSEQGLSEQEFIDNVLNRALSIEIELNGSTKLRWHVKETKDQAD